MVTRLAIFITLGWLQLASGQLILSDLDTYFESRPLDCTGLECPDYLKWEILNNVVDGWYWGGFVMSPPTASENSIECEESTSAMCVDWEGEYTFSGYVNADEQDAGTPLKERPMTLTNCELASC